MSRHEGWLKKQGQERKNWKKRYFVLTDAMLAYYEKDPSTVKKQIKPKGSVLLTSNVVIEDGACWSNPCMFLIATGGRVLVAEAESAESAQGWVAQFLNLGGVRNPGFRRAAPLTKQGKPGWGVLNQGPESSTLRFYEKDDISSPKAVLQMDENVAVTSDVSAAGSTQFVVESQGRKWVLEAAGENGEAWVANLAALGAAVNAGVARRGFLEKQGRERRNWKSRWFVLFDGTTGEKCLRYYDNKPKPGGDLGKPKGEISLMARFVVEDAAGGSAAGESLFTVRNDQRMLLAQAGSPAIAKSWVSSLVALGGVLNPKEVKKGFLVKKGQVRFFVLSETSLRYFLKEEISQAQGEIVMGGDVFLEVDDTPGLEFYISGGACHDKDTKSFVLQAATPKECALWVEAFRSIGVRINPGLVKRGLLDQQVSKSKSRQQWVTLTVDTDATVRLSSYDSKPKLGSPTVPRHEMMMGGMFVVEGDLSGGVYLDLDLEQCTPSVSVFSVTADLLNDAVVFSCSPEVKDEWFASLKKHGATEDNRILMKGFLEKCGQKRKSWKRRHVILTRHSIAYYKKEQVFGKRLDPPLGEVVLDTGSMVSLIPDVPGTFCVDGHRSLLLRSSRDDLVTSWVSAIEMVCSGAAPKLNAGLTEGYGQDVASDDDADGLGSLASMKVVDQPAVGNTGVMKKPPSGLKGRKPPSRKPLKQRLKEQEDARRRAAEECSEDTDD